MITYLDFAEDDIQKVEDVLLQCRTKAEGSRRYGAPRYAPRAAIEVQYIKFIDPEHTSLRRVHNCFESAGKSTPRMWRRHPLWRDNGESKCFNCGQPGHSVAECPEPRDQAAIQRNRREFLDSTPVRFTGRYATSQKVLLDKFKPGELSEELKQALDILFTLLHEPRMVIESTLVVLDS
ncbi:zinc knuckle domain containing protein [Acanthamoeba castellanii str. Neff]|uniref:Zinc knuckle domain containing protein n=1 Tax=Acanthamoeba castellanii (strain ATCC 30010 / Neff) TaxID=1257118 RepID=L8GME5_ACACF|nr:zinc knuckle domain containing protein [Acanthamoeba castellanii str. Neff]ELR13999.1 zinc knuckle domain containing protein [Acanthamoeba castellanii str. Neff]